MSYNEFYEYLLKYRMITPIWKYEIELIKECILNEQDDIKNNCLILFLIYFSLIQKGNATMALTKKILKEKWENELEAEEILYSDKDRYEEDEIEAALRRLEEKGYLNDPDACDRQFRFLYEESRSSVKQICAKLMQRGFDSGLVRDCIPVDTYERELRAALRCLSIKFKPGADPQKMMANLYSKGFDSAVIRNAVERFGEDGVQ